jgi:type IV pilus assembly protein PilM
MGLPFLNGQPKRRDEVVAIDLGGRFTKAIHMHRRGERLSLTNYVRLDAPEADKALNPDVLTEHLKSVARELGCARNRRATLALGVNEAFLRQVETPIMPVQPIRLMLKAHSKTYLQQDYSDHTFDCFISAGSLKPKPAEAGKPNSGQPKQKVLVGGAKKQLVEMIQKAVKDAGMIPDHIVPGLLGPPNAFELAEPEPFAKEVVALVDIGFKTTHITILDAGEFRLNRVVGIGGDRLTGALVEAMNITYAEAESIKRGIAGEVQPQLESLLSALGHELRASIDFFEHQEDRTVSQVFVSGGSAASPLIVQSLQNELVLPCQRWSPLKPLQLDLSADKTAELDEIASQLTVAVGAAAAVF